MSMLKRLQELTRMIESATGGRQQVVPNLSGGGADVRTNNDAYAALLIRTRTNYDTGDITLDFQAGIRRMGSWMTAREFQFAADEIQQMTILLNMLEQTTVTVTPDEMRQWADWLTGRIVEQAIDNACERDPQLDPTMGMP